MKEEHVRPAQIFDEYLRLTEEDTRTYFTGVDRDKIVCPACGAEATHSFDKHGFGYDHCAACDTLFVNPRPSSEAFEKYYVESPSAKYWASTFYKETAEARRELLWKPKAARIRAIQEKYGLDDATLIDIGGGYGIFAEEVEKLTPVKPMIIEPNPALAQICRDKGFTVIERFLEQIESSDLNSSRKMFVSFELFEHLHSPAIFFEQLYKVMMGGDYFVFTTLSGTGLDIKLLWENSKSVSPPHHLNFFNPTSIEIFLERMGFETIEVTTPGALDIDILIKNFNHVQDPFWKSTLATANADDRKVWQDSLVKTRTSSHMMVVCRRPDHG